MSRTGRLVWVGLILILLMGGSGMFDEARAERAVRFFGMLKHTKGRFHGQPFDLLPWQDRIVRDVYGTVRPNGQRQYKMVYLELPKKNGKSEIAAGFGLYQLYADGEMNGEVYGCAADRAQASLVFDVAVDMVDQIPALKKRTWPQLSHKRLTDKVTGTFYQVVSAEAYTKHGLNVSACIFDELHAQPNRSLWDVMTFGAGDAREQPIWIVITTAGDDPDRVSICWEVHEYAQEILAGKIEDPTWYPVIYSYPGEDIYNEDHWRQANPSLGTTIQLESLHESARKAQHNPADERLFRWLRLNQWLTYKLTTWLPLDLFDQTVGRWNRMELIGQDCYMGLDLSATTDLSALALVFPPQKYQPDWRVIWECWIPEESMAERVRVDHVPYDRWAEGGWITVTEGNVIDYSMIEDKILELARLYHVIELDADETFAAMLLQRLAKTGMTVVGVPQTFVGLSDALNLTEMLLKKQPQMTQMNMDEDAGKEKPQITQMDMDEEAAREEAPKLVIRGNELRGWMTHEYNQVARWCFGNTSVAKNGQGYLKYVKEHKGKSVDRTKRIDLTAAWITAMARARFYAGSVDISEQILDPNWGM